MMTTFVEHEVWSVAICVMGGVNEWNQVETEWTGVSHPAHRMVELPPNVNIS